MAQNQHTEESEEWLALVNQLENNDSDDNTIENEWKRVMKYFNKNEEQNVM